MVRRYHMTVVSCLHVVYADDPIGFCAQDGVGVSGSTLNSGRKFQTTGKELFTFYCLTYIQYGTVRWTGCT